jgi:hypothetical protein
LKGFRLERFNKSDSVDEKLVGRSRGVLDCGSLCRFFTAALARQSGRGLPQSKTLARNSMARAFSGATVFLKPL